MKTHTEINEVKVYKKSKLLRWREPNLAWIGITRRWTAPSVQNPRSILKKKDLRETQDILEKISFDTPIFDAIFEEEEIIHNTQSQKAKEKFDELYNRAFRDTNTFYTLSLLNAPEFVKQATEIKVRQANKGLEVVRNFYDQGLYILALQKIIGFFNKGLFSFKRY